MELHLHVEGIRPMLQHNGRLANPLDPYTRRLKAISGKRGKTDQDLADMAAIESRGSCWETSDGLMGVPVAAVWRSIYDGAKAFKLGADVKRALLPTDEVVPLTINGKTVSADEHAIESMDYRSVKVGTSRTMRARVIVRPPWSFDVSMELLDEILNPHMLAPVFVRSGAVVGLGDWRPTYGTYLMRSV